MTLAHQSKSTNVHHTEPNPIDERNFENMISEVEDYAIFLLDASGNIASWNKGAEKIKGYQAADILGKSSGYFIRQKILKGVFLKFCCWRRRRMGKLLTKDGG